MERYYWIISFVIMAVIAIGLIKLFEIVDEELKTHISITELAIITAITSVISVWFNRLYPNIIEIIHASIIVGYLIVMSYTDQKTKTVYSIISRAMLIIELVWLIYYSQPDVKDTLLVTIIPISMLMLSLLGKLGYGDVQIYTVLALYIAQTRAVPIFSMAIIVVVANTLFIIKVVITRLIKKNKELKDPLTLYITIASVLDLMFLV